jgi:hypothetical protein
LTYTGIYDSSLYNETEPTEDDWVFGRERSPSS